MPSIEIFAENVKRLLTQKNIRIKDLAERVGLSESYLSLVLNGTRKNLGDEYKDRIAACLNVSMSDLYTENLRVDDLGDGGPSFLEDPERRELKDTIDAFITKTNLESNRSAFYTVLGLMSDKEAGTVRRFLSEVLKEFGERSRRPGHSVTLSPDEEHLYALCKLAGETPRIEWIRAVWDRPNVPFDRALSALISRGLVQQVQDEECIRLKLVQPPRAVATFLLSRSALRTIYNGLAHAMLAYPDDDPFFDRMLARMFLKADQDEKGVLHLRKAARAFQNNRLYSEAAATYCQAAAVAGVLGDFLWKGRYLAEAALCAGEGGDLRTAEELSDHAFTVLIDSNNPTLAANVCLGIGNLLFRINPSRASRWYRRGLTCIRPDDRAYGHLLMNLASSSFDEGRLDAAENALRELTRWEEDNGDASTAALRANSSMLMGLIAFQRRQWNAAMKHFRVCVDAGQGISNQQIAVAWHNLGMIEYRNDSMNRARQYFLKAQEVFRKENAVLNWAYSAIELSKVALREGNLDEAKRHLKDAAEPLQGQKSIREKGWYYLISACIKREQNLLEGALEDGRRAIDIFQREAGAERDLACASLYLSEVLHSLGDIAGSRSFEKRAFQIYESRHWDLRELNRERSLLSPKSNERS